MSSTPEPPAIPHAAQVEQKQVQAILVWSVGAFCIYGWDWILCLPQEYRRIWKKKFTPITVLYLANRYFGFLQFSFALSLMADAWGPAACQHAFYWEPVGALISTTLSQMILGVRVYAIYAQNRAVAIILSSILATAVCIEAFSISLTSPPVRGPPGPGPCNAVPAPLGWLIAFWSMPLLYDTVTFLLTAWKTFDFWRKDVDTPLLTVIWRDGVIYFFAIFSMNFANLIIFLMTHNSLTSIVNLTPTLMFTVLLSCRLVINLRNTHAKAAPSGNGPTPHNNKSNNKNQAIPMHHTRDLSHDKTLTAKSEWIDTSPDKSDDSYYPGRIAVLNNTNRIV